MALGADLIVCSLVQTQANCFATNSRVSSEALDTGGVLDGSAWFFGGEEGRGVQRAAFTRDDAACFFLSKWEILRRGPGRERRKRRRNPPSAIPSEKKNRSGGWGEQQIG